MFDILFGSGMSVSVRLFIAFVIVLVLIGFAAWLVRRFGMNRFGANGARGRQPRLAVIDAAVIDGRRRLVLIRRDNIEHLLMIGGPTDFVIEPNIIRAAPTRDTSAHAAAPALDNWPLQPLNEAVPQRNYPRSEPALRAPITPRADTPGNQNETAHNAHNHNAHNNGHLTEIALRLEPKKSKTDPRPSISEPLSGLHGKSGETAMRTSAREFKPLPESITGTNTEPRFEQRLDTEPMAANELNSTGEDNHVMAVQAQSGRAPAAANKPYYDSLEEEMANLLGRPKKS